MSVKYWALAAAVAIGSAVPALAHHSFSMEYDAGKPIKISGTVTKFEWTNPHAHVYVDVVDASGKTVNWNLEMASPNILSRNGWSKADLPASTKVTVQGYAGRVDATRAVANSITLADGRSLFAGAGPDSN